MLISLQTNVSDLLEHYEKDYLRPKGRELTVNLHRLDTIDRALGRYPALSPIDIEKFLKKFRTASRNRYRALLKASLRWGKDMGYVEGDLDIRSLRAERENGARTRRMTADEETRLREVMGGDLADLFTAAIDTGLRYGALRQLRAGDVSGETLVVPADIQKHQQSQRIPLTQRLGEIVRRRIGAVASPHERLFTIGAFHKEWRAAREAAGVAGLHWHDLRGEFASRLTEAGVGVETVSRLLGHASIAMTQRYLRPRVSSFDDAIRKLGV